MPDPVPKVFICYARADNASEDPRERWLDRMMGHLKPLELSGKIKVFCDIDLEPGDHWRELIQKELEETRVAILLVSAAFMASDFIRNNEIPVLLEKAFQKEPTLKIIPVILSKSLFDRSDFKYPDPQTGPKSICLSSLQIVGDIRKGLRGVAYDEQELLLGGVAEKVAAECSRPLSKPQNQKVTSTSSTETSPGVKTAPQDLPNPPHANPSETALNVSPVSPINEPTRRTAGTSRLPPGATDYRKYLVAVVGMAAVALVLVWAPWTKQGQKVGSPSTGSPVSNLVTKSNAIRCFTNSLGMRFVPIEGTKVWFSIWETRWQDYKAFADSTIGDSTNGLDDSWRDAKFQGIRVTPTPSNPVVNVSWTEAHKFCSWLTAKERKQGLLNPKQLYRLPIDLEWSVSVGLRGEIGATPAGRHEKVPGVYPWGTTWPPPVRVGNFADDTFSKAFSIGSAMPGYDDGFATTSPVGSFLPMANGLYDLSGNVWEWCEDWFDQGHKEHVLRGGAWIYSDSTNLLSSCRNRHDPGHRSFLIGFRVVLSGGESGSPGGD